MVNDMELRSCRPAVATIENTLGGSLSANVWNTEFFLSPYYHSCLCFDDVDDDNNNSNNNSKTSNYRFDFYYCWYAIVVIAFGLLAHLRQ